MLQNIIYDNFNYVGNDKPRRNLLSIMTKIRAAQTLGATLADRGFHERAYKIFEKIISEILKSDFQGLFPIENHQTLSKALVESNRKSTFKEKTWLLRTNIDTIYDQILRNYNEVKDIVQTNLHVQIKDAINKYSIQFETADYKNAIKTCASVLRQIKTNHKYNELVSPTAQQLVNESLNVIESSDNVDKDKDDGEIAASIGGSLDRLYNEIRLPDVYSPSSGPKEAVKLKMKQFNGTLVTDFRERNGSSFEYNIQIVDDRVMGGQSTSSVIFDEENNYLHFHGSVTKFNHGGFASFRIIPTLKRELRSIVKNTKEILLEVKSFNSFNKRFKFQLANESHLKSFNWQAEFTLEPNNEFHVVRLNVMSFWPTMFGHVLSSPGNVDFDKVDCLGIILSHVTSDGKENPDFHEGEFHLAVRSIRVIKENDDDDDDGENKN